MGLLEDARQMAIKAAREVHGMWHAGASREDGLARLQSRCPRGPMPKLVYNRSVNSMFKAAWGAHACGPDHEIVICDEPAAL
jgi:hypothetical protein